MKKKIWLLIGVFSLFLMGCGDVLTVVTVNEDGERVIHSYISFIDNTVYDTTVSLRNWRDVDYWDNNKVGDLFSDDLLFTIVNNQKNIVVLGDDKSAIEISFFDGGYKWTYYMSEYGMSETFKF